MAGCLIRLAGHDLMDFRRHPDGRWTGGSDGCINFKDGDNKGLKSCIKAQEIQKVYGELCTTWSLADFIVIGAEAMMSRTATEYDAAQPWGLTSLETSFKNAFRYGRKTDDTCDEMHLMPNPEKGCDDNRDILNKHVFGGMRWAWGATTTLMGVHTIGRAHPENSGYNGSWVMPNSTGTFNNDYYREMITQGWGAKKVGPGKHQWDIISKEKPDGLNQMMMLNTDMCLAYNDNKKSAECMRKIGFKRRRKGTGCNKFQKAGRDHFLNAANFVNKTCCAWFQSKTMKPGAKRSVKNGAAIINEGELFCGEPFDAKKKFNFVTEKEQCCGSKFDDLDDCDASAWPKGWGFNIIFKYAWNEKEWLKNFVRIW